MLIFCGKPSEMGLPCWNGVIFAMNFAFWKDVAVDTLVDAAKLFPFLLITYIFMEYLEHHTEKRSLKWLEKSGPFGPLIGALTGMLPQCGFSAAVRIRSPRRLT